MGFPKYEAFVALQELKLQKLKHDLQAKSADKQILLDQIMDMKENYNYSLHCIVNTFKLVNKSTDSDELQKSLSRKSTTHLKVQPTDVENLRRLMESSQQFLEVQDNETDHKCNINCKFNTLNPSSKCSVYSETRKLIESDSNMLQLSSNVIKTVGKILKKENYNDVSLERNNPNKDSINGNADKDIINGNSLTDSTMSSFFEINVSASSPIIHK